MSEQATSTVRLDLPVLPQVGALGPAYEAWVHKARPPGGSLRLFRSGFLEAFTHISWWVIPLFWGPVVAGLAWLAGGRLGLGATGTALGILAGLGAWTLLEYLLHRFIFHHVFASDRGRQLHFLMHGIHHYDPWDRTRLVFPPLAGVIVASLIYLPLWLLLPLAGSLAVMAGVLLGYVAYDMTHYYVHHGKPRSRWAKYVKAWHLEHHHRHPQAMWGVSSPLWDVIFRTPRPAR